MSEHTDLLIECLQLQRENRRLNQQLQQMKNLTIEMFAEFKYHRPNRTLTEESRESIRLNAGGTIYSNPKSIVKYLASPILINLVLI